jgi:glycyl-tRNA synthetase beta chain
VEAMKIHQRVFPLYQDEILTEKFLTVTNQPFATDPEVAGIIAEGNKRVLTARFYDAKFFYAEDRKKNLEEHGEKLSQMLWVRKGGTVAEKVERIQHLVQEWAPLFHASEEHALRAAKLCKNDLCTQMVYEFPELEGHVGMLLAGFDEEHPEVSAAIEEHRMPRFSSDSIAPSPVGKVIAVADRWDTLTHCFALGLQPKGSGDPLGLRRAAIGFLRTLLEANVEFDIASATQNLKNGQELCSFLLARLRADVQEQAPTDIVNAVFATQSSIPVDIYSRIQAMKNLSQSADYTALRTVFKRVMGLTKAHTNTEYQAALFTHQEEHNLADLLEQVIVQIQDASGHKGALESLCALKPALEQYFSGVMVMVDDPKIKNNRLSLLKAIATSFFQIADFSLLTGES